MTKEETIKVLQSIEDRAVDFPYMTACDWVAIAAAKRHLENSLEVKGVDYERELSKYVSNGIHRFFPNMDDDYCKMDSVIWQDYVIETAKHFFELGLKTKGE